MCLAPEARSQCSKDVFATGSGLWKEKSYNKYIFFFQIIESWMTIGHKTAMITGLCIKATGHSIAGHAPYIPSQSVVHEARTV